MVVLHLTQVTPSPARSVIRPRTSWKTSVTFSGKTDHAANTGAKPQDKISAVFKVWNTAVTLWEGLLRWIAKRFGSADVTSRALRKRIDTDLRAKPAVLDKKVVDSVALANDNAHLSYQLQRLQRDLQAERDQNSILSTLLGTISQEQLQQLDRYRRERLQQLKQVVSQPLPYAWQPQTVFKKTNLFIWKKNFLDLPTKKTLSATRTTYPAFIPPSLEQVQRGQGTFTIPVHHPVHPTKSPDARLNLKDPLVSKFLREKQQPTPFKKRYGKNSLNWSHQKVARDLLQNFYDGHGHTLEGVKLALVYDKHAQTYHVTVSGQGEYNHQEIEDLGAGTKSDDLYNAGGYGEGSKMFTVRLLASEFGVSRVIYSSADWKLSFTLGNHAGQDKERVYKTLEAVPYRAGNTLQFDTTDPQMVQALLQGVNFFYHPQNPDFHAPTFDNDQWGFKYLGLNKNGNLYVANQRFESPEDGQWHQGLEGITLYTKRKPLPGVVDYGRDRTALNGSEWSKIVREDFIKTMTDQEVVQAIFDLQDLWSPDHIKQSYGLQKIQEVDRIAGVLLLKALLDEASYPSRDRKLEVKFPPDSPYLALPMDNSKVSEELLNYLRREGFILCHPEFYWTGMPTVEDKVNQIRQHRPLQPTVLESQKIQILKKAAQALLSDFAIARKKGTSPLISAADVQQPLYLFDRFAETGTKSMLAEAIVENKLFRGAWFDRTYLKQATFEEALATYLHEMTHQYGGDGSAEFSYKMTDWLTEFISSSLRQASVRQELHDLMSLWDELSSSSQAA